MAALAIGGGFTTLANSAGAVGALERRWPALEGLGILCWAYSQHQRRMCYSGTALLVLALGSALWAQTNALRP